MSELSAEYAAARTLKVDCSHRIRGSAGRPPERRVWLRRACRGVFNNYAAAVATPDLDVRLVAEQHSAGFMFT